MLTQCIYSSSHDGLLGSKHVVSEIINIFVCVTSLRVRLQRTLSSTTQILFLLPDILSQQIQFLYSRYNLKLNMSNLQEQFNVQDGNVAVCLSRFMNSRNEAFIQIKQLLRILRWILLIVWDNVQHNIMHQPLSLNFGNIYGVNRPK